MKALQLLLIGILFLAMPIFGQVAINTSGEIAAASAILDISSSSKGVLIPRLSTNERTTIDSPANGLMVYDTDTDSFWYYYLPYLSWTEIVTTASNNLDGLTDGKSYGSSDFLGTSAGRSSTGSNCTGIGHAALYANTTGSANIAYGSFSLFENTIGSYNLAAGISSLRENISGSSNIAIGGSSLFSNTSGNSNIAIGYASNYFNQTGSSNTIIGYQAGRGTSLHNKSGNIFLGFEAGYNETSSNKLYIENSNSSAPLIGGDFATDEVYFNTNRVGIGTSIPREILEVASRTNSYGRMIVSDGGGDERNVILFVSPTASNQTARIEAFNYGTGGGLTLNFNTTGNGNSVFGGHVLPENHKTKNLGGDGQAWNNVYAHNYVTQGSAAFADAKVTQQLIDFPPKEKQTGAFDEFTEKGLKELDPTSLPNALKEDNAILIDEMTTYNYKANYEQQLQINEQQNAIQKLQKQNEILQSLVNKLIEQNK